MPTDRENRGVRLSGQPDDEDRIIAEEAQELQHPVALYGRFRKKDIVFSRMTRAITVILGVLDNKVGYPIVVQIEVVDLISSDPDVRGRVLDLRLDRMS